MTDAAKASRWRRFTGAVRRAPRRVFLAFLPLRRKIQFGIRENDKQFKRAVAAARARGADRGEIDELERDHHDEGKMLWE